MTGRYGTIFLHTRICFLHGGDGLWAAKFSLQEDASKKRVKAGDLSLPAA